MAAGRVVDDVELNKCKHQVKGGQVVQALLADEGAKQLRLAVILAAPMQSFMNKCFAAEAATAAYSEKLGIVPLESNAQAPGTDEVRSTASKQISISCLAKRASAP